MGRNDDEPGDADLAERPHRVIDVPDDEPAPDREGIEGLEYVLGEPVYHSLDEMFRSEQQHEIEERAAEEKLDQSAAAAVARGEVEEEQIEETTDLIEEVPDPDTVLAEPGLAEDELDDVSGDELDEDALSEENAWLRDEDEVDPMHEDLDVQGRSADPDKDWQGDPWDDAGRDRSETDRRRR
jgi:hypothetical protein